jgi:hypothetical protein
MGLETPFLIAHCIQNTLWTNEETMSHELLSNRWLEKKMFVQKMLFECGGGY